MKQWVYKEIKMIFFLYTDIYMDRVWFVFELTKQRNVFLFASLQIFKKIKIKINKRDKDNSLNSYMNAVNLKLWEK